MGKDQRLYLSKEVALSTLASGAAIIVNTKIDSSREQGATLMKLWMPDPSWEGKTAGEGPLLWGITWELTAVLVAEAINSDPQDEDDSVAVEKTTRKVVVLGAIPAGGVADVNPSSYRRRKIPWREVPEGATLKFFVFNADAAALTTGTIVKFNGFILTKWRDD